MNIQFVREVIVNYKGPRRKLYKGIKQSSDAVELIKRLFPDNSREHFICLYLNGAHELIAYSTIATGTANSCPVNAREIFQPGVLCGAISILVAHNHPSGQCAPSQEDRAVTKRLKEAGEILGIKLLDHLIITESDHYSFQTESLI